MAKRGHQGEGGGRKWFDGKEEQSVLTKLCECWALDASDAEAALFADISTASLSRYLDAHPEVKERKLALKERPILLARKAIIGAFDGHLVGYKKKGRKKEPIFAAVNPFLAMQYAEKKRKAEFSSRLEQTGADGAALNASTTRIYIPHNGRNPLPAEAKKPNPNKPKAE